MNLNQAQDPETLLDVIEHLDTSRVGLLFTNNALHGLNEAIISKLQGTREWVSKGMWRERDAFIEAMRPYTDKSDDYRRLFVAMVEAGHAQGVKSMIHATGRRDRVFTGNQPLVTLPDLTRMLLQEPTLLSPSIHFLTRAAVSTTPADPAAYFNALVKNFNPIDYYAGNWLEAIKTMVNTRSMKQLGLVEERGSGNYWLRHMLTTEDTRRVKIAGAIVAGLLAKGELDKNDLCDAAQTIQAKIRLIRELKIDSQIFGLDKVVSNKSNQIEPSYRIGL